MLERRIANDRRIVERRLQEERRRKVNECVAFFTKAKRKPKTLASWIVRKAT